MSTNYELATFAGGCFWCMVEPFEEMPGVQSIVSGYTGGEKPYPTYEEVISKTTGHVEAVQITFDPNVFPYTKLLDLFWRQIDPTDAGGQFFDRGDTYITAVYYHNEEQEKLAEESRKELEESGRFSKQIVTKILPAKPFYPAEDYHQDYHKKNPAHYNRYKKGSGRADFIEKNWAYEKNDDELRSRLTDIQYEVTQKMEQSVRSRMSITIMPNQVSMLTLFLVNHCLAQRINMMLAVAGQVLRSRSTIIL